MEDFLKEEHFGVGKSSNTLDGLITRFIDEAVPFSPEILSIIEHF